MTLTQLRYVIKIADTGSMNEASKALFISQPSLSQAVKELETEIGVELFKRSNRGVSVTQEGMEFLGYARQVVEQYELIESHYIERKNVKKNSECLCSIIHLQLMHLWKWSDSLAWMNTSLRSVRRKHMKSLKM